MPLPSVTARLARLALIASLAAPLAAAPLAAQSSDTTGALPFRAGQWATQFGFDGSFVSAGALRFRSQRSAWVVDVFARAEHYTYENGPAAVNDDEAEATDLGAVLQLGLRRYRPVATRTNAFAGAGLYGSTFVNRTPFDGASVLYTQREGAAGVYGELGATWMVARNLGLSGATQLVATYNWARVEQPAGFGGTVTLDAKGYGVQLARTRLMVTVYF
jgi:hypothetical protein